MNHARDLRDYLEEELFKRIPAFRATAIRIAAFPTSPI
jgi:hypothetical protein